MKAQCTDDNEACRSRRACRLKIMLQENALPRLHACRVTNSEREPAFAARFAARPARRAAAPRGAFDFPASRAHAFATPPCYARKILQQGQ